jgi:hypothetical protein
MPQFAHHAPDELVLTRPESPIAGLVLRHDSPLSPRYVQRAQAAQVSHWLQAHGLDIRWLDVQPCVDGWRYRLTREAWHALTPDYSTLDTVHRLQDRPCTRELEIALALLASPVEHVFPSFDELCAHVDARKNTCAAGERTTLAFATESAERPAQHWTYAEDTGFTLRPQAELIEALTLATQPSVSGELFSFSCYRATEYVLLLGLAQTLKNFNPSLLKQLEQTWRIKAIASGRFHEAFLTEVGSLEQPLPMHYYVPGDRVWFRNPDEASADVVGFEGSWVVYLGQGRFTDFWRPQSHYTLEHKCLEIYYWREAVLAATTATAEPQLDETIVWAKMAALQAGLDAGNAAAHAERERILQCMMRYRDGRGVYAEGGCIDATREHLRWVCPEHARIDLPALPHQAALTRQTRPQSQPYAWLQTGTSTDATTLLQQFTPSASMLPI